MKAPAHFLRKTRCGAFLAAALITLSGLPVVGAPYVSTIETPDSGNYGEVLVSDWPGFAFRTDDATYQVTSVITRMQIPGSAIGWDLKPVIYAANSSGIPTSSTALGTFSHGSLTTGSIIDLTLNPNGLIVLEANSTYLFAFTPTEDRRDLMWYFTDATGGNPGIPGSNWEVVDGIFYKDNVLPGPWLDEAEGLYTFMTQVNADVLIEPIPEPSTWVAIISGASLLAFGHLRRRRKAGGVQA